MSNDNKYNIIVTNRQLYNLPFDDCILCNIFKHLTISSILKDIHKLYCKYNSYTKFSHKIRSKRTPSYLWKEYNEQKKVDSIDEPYNCITKRQFNNLSKDIIIQIILNFNIKPLYTSIYFRDYLGYIDKHKFIINDILPKCIRNTEFPSVCFNDNNTPIRHHYRLDYYNKFTNIYLLSVFDNNTREYIMGITTKSIYNILHNYRKKYSEIILVSFIHYLTETPHKTMIELKKELYNNIYINLQNTADCKDTFECILPELYEIYSNFITHGCHLCNANVKVLFCVSREYKIDQNNQVYFKRVLNKSYIKSNIKPFTFSLPIYKNRILYFNYSSNALVHNSVYYI